MAPAIHVQETVLYGRDLEAMRAFYENVIGLRVISAALPRGLTLRVTESSVLLLFNPSETVKPFGEVPSHGSTGPGHIGFTVEEGRLNEWRRRLAEHRIPIEREIAWPLGGRSMYTRDPAGNSVEFIDGRVWPD